MTCNNACYATYCKDISRALHYDSNAEHQAERRKQSGVTKNPCNTSPTKEKYGKFGDSADEFPFATTKEGGKHGNQNAILRCVPGPDNSSQGSQLQKFYKTLKDGEEFTIDIRNYGGVQYCQKKPNCKNDGGEFTFTGKDFVDANSKHKRDLTSSASFRTLRDTATNATALGLRKFMGSDGVERLWLGTSRTGTLVGQEVWNAESGLVQITHEITA